MGDHREIDPDAQLDFVGLLADTASSTHSAFARMAKQLDVAIMFSIGTELDLS